LIVYGVEGLVQFGLGIGLLILDLLKDVLGESCGEITLRKQSLKLLIAYI
jgi:hypothetical protein